MSTDKYLAALLPLAVVLPVGAAILALALGHFWSRAGKVLAVLAAAADAALAVALLGSHLRTVQWAGGWNPVTFSAGAPVFTGIPGVALAADPFNLLMLALVGVISLLVVIYAVGYVHEEGAENRFFALFLLMIGGMNGCLLSGDLFNFWVFLELASLSSYALVGFGTRSEQLEAAFKYLVLGSLGSVFFLFGIALTWGCLGTLNMAELALKLRALGGLGASPTMLLASAFLLLGLGLKAAMVPFHGWLPDAHPSAPTPISAMLSGLLIKALGVYALAHIFIQVLGAYLVPPLAWTITVLGALSMVVGVFMAVGQWDLKRLLAYHSISQMGYVVMALGFAMVLKGQQIPQLDRQTTQVTAKRASRAEELSRKRSYLSAIETGMKTEEELAVTGAELADNIARVEKELGVYRDQVDELRNRRNRLDAALALALLGAIFHLVNHAFFKSLLFLCAGAFERATGTRNLKELGGLWQRMPATSMACATGALSISGVPPFNGFWSKLMIILAAALSGHWVLAGLAVLVSFMTLLSFVKVQKYALFGPMSGLVVRRAREAAPSMRFAVLALALGCLVLGLLVWWVVPVLIGPAADALGRGTLGWFDLLRGLYGGAG